MTLHYIIHDKNDCIIGGGKDYRDCNFRDLPSGAYITTNKHRIKNCQLEWKEGDQEKFPRLSWPGTVHDMISIINFDLAREQHEKKMPGYMKTSWLITTVDNLNFRIRFYVEARHFCNGFDVSLELERENPNLEFLPDSYFEPKP